MNWGKGIFIAMAVFMGFILTLVISLTMHHVELESEDYYQKDLKYSQEIDALENANALEEKIDVIALEEGLAIQIPDQLEVNQVTINLKRPNDENMDQSFEMEQQKTLIIPAELLEKGKYNVELNYRKGAKPFLQKHTIYFNE